MHGAKSVAWSDVKYVIPRTQLCQQQWVYSLVLYFYLYLKTCIIWEGQADKKKSLMLTGFIVYASIVLVLVLILIFRFVPRYGSTHMIVYVGICSLMGSLTVCLSSLKLVHIETINLILLGLMSCCWQVMSVKALAIALKLTFLGTNQFIYFQTWFFTVVVILCCLLQVNYLNKVIQKLALKVYVIVIH